MSGRGGIPAPAVGNLIAPGVPAPLPAAGDPRTELTRHLVARAVDRLHRRDRERERVLFEAFPGWEVNASVFVPHGAGVSLGGAAGRALGALGLGGAGRGSAFGGLAAALLRDPAAAEPEAAPVLVAALDFPARFLDLTTEPEYRWPTARIPSQRAPSPGPAARCRLLKLSRHSAISASAAS